MNLIVKLAAAGLAATTAAGGGPALASPAASPPPVTACYKTGASPAPLQRVAGGTCPAGAKGPAGPSGARTSCSPTPRRPG